MMNRAASLLFAILLLAGLLAGCEDPVHQTQRTLRIAMSPDFAPMEFVDPTKSDQDQFVGFDVFLARYIAQELGMELEIMPMEFNACQMAVYAGTVDLSVSGYTWSEKREKDYNLSDRYYAGDTTDHQILITLADKGDAYSDAESLSGAKVAVQSASLQLVLAQSQLPDSEIHVFYDLDTAVRQLLDGDFDCVAVSGGNARAILAAHPEIVPTGFSFQVEEKYRGYVILLQKGNDELTRQVNEILASAQAHYDEWYAQALSIAGVEVHYDENGNTIPQEGDTLE